MPQIVYKFKTKADEGRIPDVVGMPASVDPEVGALSDAVMILGRINGEIGFVVPDEFSDYVYHAKRRLREKLQKIVRG